MSADRAATLVELLRRRAEQDPDRVAYRFLADGESESHRLSFAQVDRRARAIAAALQDAGAAGERVLLSYPAERGTDYVTGFLGCVLAGAVAVPCDGPHAPQSAARLGWIAQDARPAVVLGATADRPALDVVVPPGALRLDVADVGDDAAACWIDPGVRPGALALLQYTSGSTRRPCGVRVTHANVLANERAIALACEHDRDCTFVGWLPLFHDMGMIADVLQPLYLGGLSVLMPPAAFLSRPLRWLAAIDRYHGVAAGGPNFAFELCVGRTTAAERAGLDLTRWRTAFNGAEVVRPATLRRFSTAFADAGFAPESFLSCYGLAEATLIVSAAPRHRPPVVLAADTGQLQRGRLLAAAVGEPARHLVSSGRVVVDTVVTVVDPATGAALPDGEVGEIRIEGPGVADGYWGVDGDPAFEHGSRHRRLRTGDLGAVAGGELFVVGRLKDLIIVRGANHHPGDVEWTAEHSHRGLRRSCVAAFAVGPAAGPASDGPASDGPASDGPASDGPASDGPASDDPASDDPSSDAPSSDGPGERVVVVGEPAGDGVDVDDVARAVRGAVAKDHGLHVHEVVLVARGSVEKTTSGKVRRAACREAYLSGALRVLGRSGLPDPAPAALPDPAPALPDPERLARLPDQDAIAELATGLLLAAGGDPGARSLPAAGLDSLRAVELQQQLHRRYHVELAPFALLGDRSLNEVCAEVLAGVRAGPLRPAGPDHGPDDRSPDDHSPDDHSPDDHSPDHGSDHGPARAPAAVVQRALWFEHALAPPGPAYVLTRALRLRGALDTAALHLAVARLAARHPALRLHLGIDGGEVILAEHDHREPWLTEARSGPDLAATLAEVATERLDPDTGPLIRFLLLHRDRAEAVLVLRAHHAMVDFWSAVVLVRELFALYAAEIGGAPAALGPCPPGPVEQARAEAALLASERGATLRAYWARRLSGAPPASEPAPARPRPAVRLFRGATTTARIGARVTGRLRSLARERECTIFAILLAAHQLLVGRLSGQRDVVVGTFAAGRDRAEHAGAVGCRATLVPVRTVLQPGEGFDRLIERVRDGLLADLAHAQLPFAEIVREARPGRAGGRHPLVQTALVFQQEPGERHEGLRSLALGVEGRPFAGPPGLVVQSVAVAQQWTHLDLTINVAERAGGLDVVVEYDTALYDRDDADALVRRWVTLLAGAAARPGTPTGMLGVLPGAERASAVAAGYGGPPAPGPPAALHELVRHRWLAWPDRVVLVADGAGSAAAQLSAGAARRWAHRLTARLAAAGVRTGHRVGVLLERGLALPVALLAVLQRGAAYVPLDPDDPPERVAWMLADAGVAVVLTDAALRRALPGTVRAVDVDPADPAGPPATLARASPTHPELPAYVLYTSGSTGRQKGVIVPHRAIVNRLRWMQRVMALRGADRVLQKTPATFDVSLWEFFWPLIDGATMVLAPPGAQRDPERLAGVIERSEVTICHSVPTALTHLLPWLARTGCPALRRVVSSGEALPAGLRDRLHRALPAELDNLYGPTETTVDVTWWPCPRDEAGDVPIGRPIDGTEVHVLGPHDEPLPAGVAGEIGIGGVALAHGYCGRPASTAAAYRPHPFGRPGERLYRSGDRALRRADGAVRFLGRGDRQVSLGGRRVELGEIEEALRSAPGVRAAAVTVADEVGGGRVIGYLAGPAASGDLRAVREYVQARLPAALVPAQLRALPALPLTANGKLDRARLAAGAAPSVPGPGAVGADPLRSRLTTAWEGVLGRQAIGPDDDFFALGGDSILALRLVAGLCADGIEVSVAQLLANPTVRCLAGAVRHAGSAAADPVPEPFGLCPPGVRELLATDLEDVFPVSSAQQAVLFHQLHGEAHEVYVTSLRLRGGCELPALRAAAAAVFSRHPYLRSSFDLSTHREPLQLVHARTPVPLETVDLRGLPAAEADRRVAEWRTAQRTRPLDVERGPLARLAVHRRGDGTWNLTLSSFALDGWATATVLTELLVGYTGGPEPQAPRASFRTFVAHERAAAQDAAHREFWAQELAGAPQARLPSADACAVSATREPDSQVPSAGEVSDRLTRRIEAPVDDATATELRRLALRWQVGERSLLLAAHLRVVRALTGRCAVSTGVEVTGRPEGPDGDRVVGVFNNIVVLRVPVTGTWEELVRAGTDAERRVGRYRRYPLAQLERDQGRPGLLSTLFVYTHFHAYRALDALPGLTVVDSWAPDRTYVPLTTHVNIDATTGRMRLLLDYDPRVVDPSTAALAAALFHNALAALVRAPERSCLAEALLPPAHLQRQLRAAAGPAAPVGPGTAAGLVAEQARRTPDAIAVAAGGESISYRALLRRAAGLSAALRAAGATPGSVLAVPARRTPDLLVSVLAGWGAGAAYLPVDPDEPAERVCALLAAAGVTLVVAGPDATGLSAAADRVVSPGAVAAPRRPLDVDPRQLAYVLPTSGSTGAPKPVGVSHRALANYLQWCAGRFGSTAGTRTPVHSPVGFDLTVTSLLAPLVTGGCVELLPAGAGPEAIGHALLDGADGLLKITPAHLAAVAQQLRGSRIRVAAVVAGGAPLLDRHVAAWRSICPDVLLINEYGPTEATVGCVAHQVTGAGPGRGVPIGRPIAAALAHVLDEGIPVPDGVVGELTIGGPGLARGYLGAPGHTAERFVPDPFGNGDRLYRTGDLARRDPAGVLHLVGRRDRQLKVRGRRIEPAAVEAAITAHPEVRQAAVRAVELGPDRHQLVAYWVSDDPAEPGAAALAAWTATRLPAPEVPDRWMWLPRLALTARGKIDYAALPDPGAGEAIVRRALEPPRAPVERALAAVWAEVLELDDLGIDDDYFAVGGDSIAAVAVVARSRAAGIEITTQDLFELRTVRRLAAAGGPAAAPAPGRRADPPSRMALTPLQQGLLYHSLADPSGHTQLVQVTARLDGTDGGGVDLDRLAAACRALPARHPALRVRLHWDGTGTWQSVAPHAELPVRFVDLRPVPPDGLDDAVRAELRRERAAGVDLRTAPLLRVALLLLPGGAGRFVLTHHHLVLDGWSQQLLLHDLLALHDGGYPAGPPTSGDGLRAHRAWLAAGDPAADLTYWRERLAGFVPRSIAPAAAALPPDAGRALTRQVVLPGAPLRAAARALAITVPSVLYAAWAVVVGELAAADDVAIGVTLAGRPAEVAGLDTAIGMFVTTLPLRVDLRPAGDVAGWLRTVHRHRVELDGVQRSALTDVARCAGGPGIGALFDALAVVENFPEYVAEGTRSRRLRISDITSEVWEGYPLVLEAHPAADLVLRVRADSGYLSPERVDAVLTALARVLALLAAGPGGVGELRSAVRDALHGAALRAARRRPVTDGSTTAEASR